MITKEKTCWITTFVHKKKFDLLNPNPDDIHIEDIAYSLAHVCRFTGHVRRFYSVAEHCMNMTLNLPKELQLAGLLHDASEAYLNDINSPLKSTDELQGYKKIENKIQIAIFNKYGIPLTVGFNPKIKEIDKKLLYKEASISLGLSHNDLLEWGATDYSYTSIKLKDIINPDDSLLTVDQYFAKIRRNYTDIFLSLI